MINIENYESYLFLYQEGELDSATCAEVERFLLEHPDIREEMEQYYDPSFVVTAPTPQPIAKRRHHLTIWRWSVAACLLFAVGVGIYLLPSTTTGNDVALVAKVHPTEAVHHTIQQSVAPVQDDKNIIPHETGHSGGTAHTVYSPEGAEPTIAEVKLTEPEATIKNTINSPIPETKKVEPTAPEYILTDRLALEPIIVDNLAVDVPNISPYPSTHTNLAGLLMAFSDRKKKDLLDFFRQEPVAYQQTIQIAQVIN